MLLIQFLVQSVMVDYGECMENLGVRFEVWDLKESNQLSRYKKGKSKTQNPKSQEKPKNKNQKTENFEFGGLGVRIFFGFWI